MLAATAFVMSRPFDSFRGPRLLRDPVAKPASWASAAGATDGLPSAGAEDRDTRNWRGAALYVGALVGPGVLLVPSLAVAAAGPESIVAWAGLFVLSAPLAVAFAALGVRHPVAGGVSA